MKGKGSITIFGCVTMMLVSQVLFVYLEGSRRAIIKRSSQVELETAMESMFASYNQPLWERYQLLGWDESQLDAVTIIHELEDLQEDTTASNLLRYQIMGDAQVQRVLMTDGNGKAYRKAVVSYMTKNLLAEALDLVVENQKEIQKLEDSSGGTMDYYYQKIEDAQVFLKEFKEDEKGSHPIYHINRPPSVQLCKQEQDLDELTEPFSIMGEGMPVGLMGILLPRGFQLSPKSVQAETLLSNRKLQKGNMAIGEDINFIERNLFLGYLFSRFGYLGQTKGTALNYELEYLVCGKTTDKENLSGVANRILLARMGANVLTITQSESMMTEAELEATALAALIMTPEAKDAFKVAIITSWAYAESILDVRSLLDGKRIPLVKTQDQWTVKIFLLSNAYLLTLDGAIESERGLSYEDYLKAYVYIGMDEVLSKRAMDLQEQNIRKYEGYEEFRMDNLVCKIFVEQEYEAEPVFLKLVTLIPNASKKYGYNCEGSYSYWESN